MGFSAFSGGGRFEALQGPDLGTGDCSGAGRWCEARVASVASGAREREGPEEMGGAGAAGLAESAASRSWGCAGPEGAPGGRGFASVHAAAGGVQPGLGGLRAGPPPASPALSTRAHTSLPDAFCRTSCNMAAATAA